jgi:hypothetical protein
MFRSGYVRRSVILVVVVVAVVGEGASVVDGEGKSMQWLRRNDCVHGTSSQDSLNVILTSSVGPPVARAPNSTKKGIKIPRVAQSC